MTGPLNQVLTSWHIDNRVSLLPIERRDDAGLPCTLSTRDACSRSCWSSIVLSLTPMMHRTPTVSADG
jgi:hypothetical protein